ncbi:hypothetical protein DFH07DRAFT_870421 [Mycena maculata]|uniref:Uncharacterized protein n=1 Tax=Mycena maculata TaxID=230809 RepID=A0AAD7N140_9AGAR|nr:hypothetical protein DFH07DRAFT_870421 [Mycena maculata]
MLNVPTHRSLLSSYYLVAFLALFAPAVVGQDINGQTFTHGLAIIDAPAPSSPGHAGSPLPIAVDVSGDGKIQAAASVPGSGLSTRFDALEIYLVSSQTNINMTVSDTPDFLTGESGSTVKHLNWPVPTCLTAGNYNLTFYETSHFNGQAVFTITPILVPILNSSPPGQCNSSVLNSLQSQPQPSNPLTQSPFAPNSSTPVSTSGTSGSGRITATGPSPALVFLSLFVSSVYFHRA